MSHFHTSVPNDIFYSFLDELCLKTNKYYLFNQNSYKKMFYTDDNNDVSLFEQFREILLTYYHEDKAHYITRDMTYNRFTSVLRQICKNNKVPHSSAVKYANSQYCIEHFIYYG